MDTGVRYAVVSTLGPQASHGSPFISQTMPSFQNHHVRHNAFHSFVEISTKHCQVFHYCINCQEFLPRRHRKIKNRWRTNNNNKTYFLHCDLADVTKPEIPPSRRELDQVVKRTTNQMWPSSLRSQSYLLLIALVSQILTRGKLKYKPCLSILRSCNALIVTFKITCCNFRTHNLVDGSRIVIE